MADSSENPTPKPRLEMKKYTAVLSWAWEVDVEHCAICRNQIMAACIECQATTDNIGTDPAAGCTAAWGVCNHAFHFHCISRWLRTRKACPMCNRPWEFARYGV